VAEVSAIADTTPLLQPANGRGGGIRQPSAAPPLHIGAAGRKRETAKIGRMADYRARRSRFKIFPTNESSYAVSAARCTFGRINRPFIDADTHEKRMMCNR